MFVSNEQDVKAIGAFWTLCARKAPNPVLEKLLTVWSPSSATILIGAIGRGT